MGDTLILMEGIEKTFPGVHALKHCYFELKAGEVHALVGENGAGKSTLMKVLTGVYTKDAGRILYKGKEVEVPNPKAAQDLGIAIIHQELHLMPHLTVAQNIFIGREPRKGARFVLDEKQINQKAQALLNMMNLDLDPKARVGDLTVAKQQMVEIVRALSFRSEVLIMDEPTSMLTGTEIDELFRIIRELRDRGVGIVHISHRMEELKQISDRVTVMRDGRYIDTVETQAVTIDKIISMMVGQEIYETARSLPLETKSEVVLKVRNLNRGRALKDISFELRRGEILGFAGLVGAGRTEVARAIFGADPIDFGEIYVHGERVQIGTPNDAVKFGIGYLSEDRRRYGVLPTMDVETNIIAAAFEKFTSNLGWVNKPSCHDAAQTQVDELRIKTPSLQQRVRYLSGGNQQKVVMAKWMVRDCDILICDEPTRGIDVGAKSEVYKLLNDLAESGKAIIMISSELPEILRMSHRIIVMCEGRITGELTAAEATQERILQYATKRESIARH
ncbi:MAG: sugar ABC transporter ATP-binding protein [Firmicutes bacterium]|nr:sugar ABC transporter ATP-binding protein [Bacillota bacterium]